MAEQTPPEPTPDRSWITTETVRERMRRPKHDRGVPMGEPATDDQINASARDSLAEGISAVLARDNAIIAWADAQEVAAAVLASTCPAVLDALEAALVRAGRLTEERQVSLRGDRSTGGRYATQRRLVTGWREAPS